MTTFDARDPDTSFPPITPLRPPEGAPNVLVVLLDDTGFGAASTFGGPVNTPTFDGLAQGGLRYTRFHTTAPCSPHQGRAYDGGGPGKGGTVDLFLDGTKVGQGKIDATQAMIFCLDETADVGSDTATPVSDDYTSTGSVFTGKIHWVQIDLAENAQDADHLITPEERYRVAMTRQ